MDRLVVAVCEAFDSDRRESDASLLICWHYCTLATSPYHRMKTGSETEDVLETKVCQTFHLYEIVAVLVKQQPAFTHSVVFLVGCLLLFLV